ncbi:MAG: Ig-like domain-containing protein, partial [Candidatus Aenigmatarchaeota archaeon]
FTFNISVRVSNSDNNVAVCAYFSKTGTEPWKLVGCDSYPAPGSSTGQWRNFTFRFDAGCEDIGSPVFAKFNATNNAGTTNSTSTTFAITKDKVIFEDIIGNGTETRRGKTTTLLALRVRDANGTLVTNLPITFYVTLDGSIYDSGTTNLTNSSAYANYYFQAKCSPKYQVGYQKWKAVLSNDACYQDNSTENYYNLRVLVTGDILLDLIRPDNSPKDQEDIIIFLGSTNDDCNDALTTNVIFFANHTLQSFECSDVEQVGSNAYTCDWHTDITTPMGWYNITMLASKENHYTNFTTKYGIPGFFYLNPIYKLEEPQSYPNQEGWGYKNWNFTVLASSGNSEEAYDVNIYLGNLWPPALPCYECKNATPTSCIYPECYKKPITFLRNFSASEIGTWYYRFSLGPTSTTEVKYVIVEKDDVSLEYSEGNNSIVIRNSQPALLSVRVYDLDAETYELSPPALVTFKIYDERYPNGYKIIGSNYTNSSGYANYLLNITECYGWLEGSQKWSAEIDSSDVAYKKAFSENYTITIQLPGCQPQVDIYSIELPKETFQYRNFTILTYVTSWVSSSTDVYINISLPPGWEVDQQTKYLGTIGVGEFREVYWNIYPSSFGEENVTFYVNSSNAGFEIEPSDKIIVYKFAQLTENSLPINLVPTKSAILKFDCEAGIYRVSNLSFSVSSGNSLIKIESFNSSDWIKIQNNLEVTQNSYFIPILTKQISPDSNGECKIRITNIGENSITLQQASLSTYYNESLRIEGIKAFVGEKEVESLDSSESYFNISVRVGNSLDLSKEVNLTLKIVKGGNELYSNKQSFTLSANSFSYLNFTNIPTTSWEEGSYKIIAILESSNYNETNYREIIFSSIKVDVEYSAYQCNSTTEKIKVKIYQPLEDLISYNISLEVPPGWSYSPSSIQIEPKGKGYYEVEFNLTAFSDSEQDYKINVSVEYNYSNGKRITKDLNIKVSPNIPILEVVREIPSLVSSSIVFKPRITIHNKGCGVAINTTLKEFISAGWIGANPSIARNEYYNDPEVSEKDVELLYSETDLVNNILTWKLGEIKPNQYAVLTYQVKAPATLATEGSFFYNISWNNYYLQERIPSKVYTFNYTQESHLEFDLEAVQDPNYPWPEVRSLQVNKPYNLTLKVTNIGDTNTNSEWIVKLYIPFGCEVLSIVNGIWNSSERKIVWNLGNLATYQTAYLNFTLNCSEESQFTLKAEGIRDTTSKIDYENTTSISCYSSSKPAYCYYKTNYVLTKPPNPRYERLSNLTLQVFNIFEGNNLTIGNSQVKVFDDLSREHIILQDFSFENKQEMHIQQFIIPEELQNSFINSLKSFEIESYTDATSDTYTNISILKIFYTWDLGKIFNETQNLFIKSKVYTYAPLLRNAKIYINENDSVSIGGWGEKFKFSVETRDRFGRDVTIKMYHRKVGDIWNLVDEKVCYSCYNWEQFNFTYDY